MDVLQEVNFEELFSRAKQSKTLEIMVRKQVEMRRYSFDPAIQTYSGAARLYRTSNPYAAKMFDAAAKREIEIVSCSMKPVLQGVRRGEMTLIMAGNSVGQSKLSLEEQFSQVFGSL